MLLTRNIGCVLFSMLFTACASTGSASKSEKQQEILKMKDQVLTQLFAKKADTRSQLNSAPGYAVFSNANVNLIFMAAGGG